MTTITKLELVFNDKSMYFFERRGYQNNLSGWFTLSGISVVPACDRHDLQDAELQYKSRSHARSGNYPEMIICASNSSFQVVEFYSRLCLYPRNSEN